MFQNSAMMPSRLLTKDYWHCMRDEKRYPLTMDTEVEVDSEKLLLHSTTQKERKTIWKLHLIMPRKNLIWSTRTA
nr:MAG TPA: hypothetical protein [Caudoviricetes sp.]